jgi:Carboxypeptidase regulatory-like domain
MTLRRCLVFLMLLTASAFAQETKKEKRQAATERVVTGTVRDADGTAINGAVVQLKDVRSTQVRSFITQKDGGYHFSGLKIDNDYELEARYSGMTSGWKTLSVFDTRKEPVVNLKLDKKDEQGKKK